MILPVTIMCSKHSVLMTLSSDIFRETNSDNLTSYYFQIIFSEEQSGRRKTNANKSVGKILDS